MTAPERAPLGAALALLVALLSLVGPAAPALLAVAIAACSVFVAIGWPELLELPSRRGTGIVVGACGVAASAVALASPTHGGPLSGVLVVCALGVLASFAHQMLRPHRGELSASLTGTVAGSMLTGLAGCWVLAMSAADAAGLAALPTSIAAGLSATLLVTSAPLPRLARLLGGAATGAAVTALVAQALLGTALPLGLLLGLVVAVAAAGAHLLLDSLILAEEPGPSLAVAATPVLTVGVIAQLAVSVATGALAA